MLLPSSLRGIEFEKHILEAEHLPLSAGQEIQPSVTTASLVSCGGTAVLCSLQLALGKVTSLAYGSSEVRHFFPVFAAQLVDMCQTNWHSWNILAAWLAWLHSRPTNTNTNTILDGAINNQKNPLNAEINTVGQIHFWASSI